jgi:hypothetical protein
VLCCCLDDVRCDGYVCWIGVSEGCQGVEGRWSGWWWIGVRVMVSVNDYQIGTCF